MAGRHGERAARASPEIAGGGGPSRAPAGAAPRLGLSRTQRIRKRPDFLRIQDGGVRVGTRHFLVLLSAGPSPDAAPRIGIVASRKVGGAVVRNRAKRLVREVFRHAADLFPAGLDVVVIVRAGAHELAFADAQGEFRAVSSLIHRRSAEVLAARAAPGQSQAPRGAARERRGPP